MKRTAIAFYWTFPVPWAGFNQIDTRDIDTAASQSKTIAMQRQAVRAYASSEGLVIIHETAHIELAPDRGSKEIEGELQNLAKLADLQQAKILYVDFGEAIHQRSHQYLRSFVGEHSTMFEAVALDWSIEQKFRDHFSNWRKQQENWTRGKAERIALARARTLDLLDEGRKLPEIAQSLEAEGLRSATGKPWNADSLRKMLKQSA